MLCHRISKSAPKGMQLLVSSPWSPSFVLQHDAKEISVLDLLNSCISSGFTREGKPRGLGGIAPSVGQLLVVRCGGKRSGRDQGCLATPKMII